MFESPECVLLLNLEKLNNTFGTPKCSRNQNNIFNKEQEKLPHTIHAVTLNRFISQDYVKFLHALVKHSN